MNRPNKRLLLSLLAILLVLVPALPAVAAPSALQEATKAWKSLSNDGKRRLLRHHWVKVIAELERASVGHQACSWRELGLVRAAQAAEEMASVSLLNDDFASAVEKFLVAGEACPGGRLSDDAYVYAARLQSRLKDVEGERSSLQKAIAVGGDMRAEAEAALAKLPPPPKKSPQLLADATEHFAKLKQNKRLRFYRHNWLAAIERFEKAGHALAPSRDGAIAFMRGAKASEEVSRISKRPEDARKAIELYVLAADRSPSESLVDDALLEAAQIELNRFGDTEAARRHLERAIAFDDDMKAEARRLLATLPKPAPKKKPASVLVARKDKAPKPAAPAPEKPTEDELPDEPVSPQLLVEATFGRDAVLGDEDGLAELMQRVDAMTQAEEQKSAVDNVRELKREALGGDWSLSEQLGAKVRRVVVDAGHGGHDAGAIGPTGVKEKDVTLQIAKRLAKILRARGYEVVLTREDDTFLALEERTKLANEARGDLFISIHANAHTSPKRGGIETYALNVASDRFAMRLAARENASTERSVGDLQFLLADLATRANTADSDRLASFVQEKLVHTVRQKHGAVRDRGVKHALFYVLLGARMPAILVETAFVSNPKEEKWLASGAFQQNTAVALADGIDGFVSRRSQLASVDR